MDAALTDDALDYEYLAGVIAAATDKCDNAHLFSLITRLSPNQLNWHYQIYLATVSLIRDEPVSPGDWRSLEQKSIVHSRQISSLKLQINLKPVMSMKSG